MYVCMYVFMYVCMYVCSTMVTSIMILSSSMLHGAVKISGSRTLRHLATINTGHVNIEWTFSLEGGGNNTFLCIVYPFVPPAASLGRTNISFRTGSLTPVISCPPV